MPRTADLPLAARILREARELYEKHDAFAIALAQAGAANPETGQPYTDSQMSKWLKGRSEPPFDVILAAAKLAQFSIDRHLFPEEAGETDRKDRERLDRLEAREARRDQDIQKLSENVELLLTRTAELYAELDEYKRGEGQKS